MAGISLRVVVDKQKLGMSTDDTDATEDSQNSYANLGSQDNTDLDATVDSADDTPSGDEIDQIQTYPFQSGDNIVNATEKAITSFERFIFPEWPGQIGKSSAEALRLALRVLRLQLMHGGGFCTDMKQIDLSTPANVRFDIQDVLDLFKDKMSHCTLNSIEKLLLPNVKELTAGGMVKDILEGFCRVLCGENGKIKELVLRSDKISNEFTAGDLEWVTAFLSSYNLDRVTIYPAKRGNKEYKKFCKSLCGKKKIDYFDKTSFLIMKKCPRLQDVSNTCKRAHTETVLGEDSKTPSDSDQTDDELTEISCNKSYFTVLWDQWKTDELHEKGITGNGVTIAVLDSGINIAHEAFKGRIIAVNDITCNGGIDLTTDRSGHGTLCASIACGAAFKSFGSKGQAVRVPAGVAPGADIVLYKITDKAGQAHAANITKALEQCLEDKGRYGIDIVLLSYGSRNYDLKLHKAIDALISQGVLVVTASGNDGEWKEIPYPARFGHTICVGAHDKHGRTTPNTSEGQVLDFTAPGKNLTGASSVHPTMFITGEGTSLAAACVAGLLALIIQRSRDIAISMNIKLLGIEPTINDLVHNGDTIKKFLRNISKHPSKHKISDGYGFLKPATILLCDNKLLEMLYEDVLITKE